MLASFFPRQFASSFIILLAALAVGCSGTKVKTKAVLERADKYFDEGRFKEAIIEYKNVLQSARANKHAIHRLGLALFEIKEYEQAFPYLLQALDEAPNDVSLRMKLGDLFLAGERFEDAREQGICVLEIESRNLDALVLVANSSTAAAEVDEAIGRLEEARGDFDSRASYHVALGKLYFKKRDAAGSDAEFHRAVEVEPDSSEAQSALGSFLLAKRDRIGAEAAFQSAAATSPPGSAARTDLADFYLKAGDAGQARQVLEQAVAETPDSIGALRLLAALAVGEGRWDDADRAIQALLAKDPTNSAALFMRGQVKLGRGQAQEAVADFGEGLKKDPKSVTGLYYLAKTKAKLGDLAAARAGLEDAIRVAPDFPPAHVLLAELNLRLGDTRAVVSDLEQLLQSNPSVPRAYVLLGLAYTQAGEPAKGEERLRRYLKVVPNDAEAEFFLGLSLKAQGKTADAARAYEAALAIKPDKPEPLTHLMRILLESGDHQGALDRINKQMAATPDAGYLHYLLGEVHLSRQELEQAEAEYLKAAAMDPRLSGALLNLARAYAKSGRYPEAVARLDQAIATRPDDPSLLLLRGYYFERSGDLAKAREVYEAMLKRDPSSMAALNNLALLLVQQKDVAGAQKLAEKAKGIAPDDPAVTDTYGWVLYQAGQFQPALAQLIDAAHQKPDSAEIQFHLGMTQYRLGQEAEAKQTLSKAIALQASFPGADEARKALSDLE